MHTPKTQSTPNSPTGQGQTRSLAPPEDNVSELARVLDQCLADLQAGKKPDRAQLLADHPSLATLLEQALDGLEFIHRAATDPGPAPVQLGDYRILREVGRGGMGVVYEAEQVTLKRRVALKVLRFGAVADEVAMQRFQREAETVARLHHTNIVPIFAVGCEQGARYYAMQFIAGRDLGDLLKEARQGGQTLTPEAVSQWGLQAAEAIAHAHARGVIHRDIKPSNLILDCDGRIWLTDFGLARRVDDVALSVAGALLGTPRYMSPEQARASKDPIDHRTDVYSLGATLYELATGVPIFEADTAHEVLSQILHTEPRAPRQLKPGLPRDFETIILKCLAKEPSHRYATAQALADDLRSFLEGRAISARPPSMPERVVRWARQHRRTTTVAAFSAGVSLVLAASAYLVWQDRQQARLGRMELTTDSPNLLGEVLDADGRALSPIFPVPTPKPVILPAGAHQLRLSASGLLSETWPMEITRRQTRTHFVQLNPRWLWPPGEVNTAEQPETEIVTLGTHADLIVRAQDPGDQPGRERLGRVRRLDGSTGRPVWPSDLVLDETTLPPGGNLDQWKALLNPVGLSSFGQDTGLADRARDLDGDGVADLVLLSRTSPSLLAVSGAGGRVLWWSRAWPVPALGPGAQASSTNGWKLEDSGRGFVMGLPTVADVDADGTPDFVACFHSDGATWVTSELVRHRTGPQSLLGAISGRTGAVLWQARLDEDWSHYIYSSTDAEKYQPLGRPALAQVGGRAVVVLVEKSRLLGFDARTGEPAWAPCALGFEPDRAPDIADLDGDGQSEALFLRLREGSAEGRTSWAGPATREFSEETSLGLLAISLPDGVSRWEKPFCVTPKWQDQELRNRRRQFHTVTDLDGDGRPEMVLSGGWRTFRGGSRLGFEVLDGRTGSNRWHRLVSARHYFGGAANVETFIVGPDLDGDHHREVFAVWDGYDESSSQHGLYVGALSGATGAMLWRAHQPGASGASALAWWHAGGDGWPLLLVSAGRAVGGGGVTLVLAAGSGRVEHTLPDVVKPRAADFDGDGILDLFYTVSPQGAPRNLVVKGTVPDAWRQLGDWRPATDLDGDGFTDLVGIADGVLSARSGRGGRLLWQAKKGRRDSPMESPQAAGDFDGDGVADVLATVNVWRELPSLAFTTQPLPAAFSGRDGRLLWIGEGLATTTVAGGSGRNWSYRYPLVDWADLDRDGRAEALSVLVSSNNLVQLSAVSGRDGHVLWRTPMTRGGFALKPSPAGRALADFNGDQVLDLALWVPASPAESRQGPLKLNVIDGRTGDPLWPHPAVTVHHPDRLIWPEPAVADLDRDGVPEVLITRHGGFDQQRNHYSGELVAVDGRNGAIRWSWSWSSGFPQLWPPVILKPGVSGPLRVGLVVQAEGVTTLVMLDAHGQPRVRRELNLPGRQFESGLSVWRACDADGDGRDELLFLDDGKLCLAAGDDLDVRWRWTLPSEVARLADVQPAGPGFPVTLTVWSGRDVYGLDGATGQPRWRCSVNDQPRGGGADVPEAQRLASDGPLSPPRVQWVPEPQFNSGFSSRVRQAWPISATGRYLAPQALPATYRPVPEVTAPRRRLPWAMADTVMIFSGAMTLLVIGLPGLLAGWAVRRRSWRLGLLVLGYAGLSLLLEWRATIPAVVALGYAVWFGQWALRARRWPVLALALVYAGLSSVVLLVSQVPSTGPEGPIWLRPLQMAVAGGPALVFWVMCGRAIRRRGWKELLGLLGASLVASLLVAATWLWSDQQQGPSDETYSWRGAYFIWFLGVALTGLLGMVILGGRNLVGWFRRRRAWKRPGPTTA